MCADKIAEMIQRVTGLNLNANENGNHGNRDALIVLGIIALGVFLVYKLGKDTEDSDDYGDDD